MVLKCFALCKTFQENWPILLGDGMMENINRPIRYCVGRWHGRGGGGAFVCACIGYQNGWNELVGNVTNRIFARNWNDLYIPSVMVMPAE